MLKESLKEANKLKKVRHKKTGIVMHRVSSTLFAPLTFHNSRWQRDYQRVNLGMMKVNASLPQVEAATTTCSILT